MTGKSTQKLNHLPKPETLCTKWEYYMWYSGPDAKICYKNIARLYVDEMPVALLSIHAKFWQQSATKPRLTTFLRIESDFIGTGDYMPRIYTPESFIDVRTLELMYRNTAQSVANKNKMLLKEL